MHPYKNIIEPRLIKLDLDKVVKYCHKDNKFLSFFMFSMSTLFPIGESNFIRLANLIKGDIRDEKKKKEIELFVEQELNHQKVHKIYNEKVSEKIPCSNFLRKRETYIKSLTKRYFARNKNNYPLFAYRLYLSEKYSEAAGLWFLDINNEFSFEERKLWTWHSYEEIEHNFLGDELLKKYILPSILNRYFMKIRIISWFLEIFIRTLVFSFKDGLFKKTSFYKDMFMFFFKFKYFPKLFIYIFKSIFLEQEILAKKDYIKSLLIKKSYS